MAKPYCGIEGRKNAVWKDYTAKNEAHIREVWASLAMN